MLGGSVALEVRPFTGRIFGHAFLPCAETRFRIDGEPIDAFVLVDAAAPSAYPADLPDFHPILHGDRFFAEGGLTAMRSGRSWIVVKQGTGVRQRIVLLDRLSAVTPSS